VTAGTASFHLPPDLEAAVSAELDAWRAGDKVRRLWARDATLWTGTDEASWLGWLGVAGDQLARVDALRELAAEVRAAGFTHALVLGMGGSSLCPEVLKMTFGRIAGYPVCRLRPALPALDRAGVQGRTEFRRVHPDHL
jgi:transaldolase/glucose-6-phosphate isomerase